MPATAVVLDPLPAISNDGVIKLSWQADVGETVEIQRARDSAFEDARSVYTGTDTSSVQTGLADGTYFFRSRRLDSESDWSEAVTVTVKHHSLPRAFGFLMLGALVFLATALLIARGGRKS